LNEGRRSIKYIENYTEEEAIMAEENGQTRRQFFQKHIENWKKSKKSQRDYCKGSGLSYHAFQYWMRVFRGEEFKKKPLPVVKVADGFDLQSLCRVSEVPGRGPINLWIGECRIEVCPGFCPETLSQVIRTLKAL